MAERAAHLGQPALALTDHGNVHGAIDFYQAARKNGMMTMREAGIKKVKEGLTTADEVWRVLFTESEES